MYASDLAYGQERFEDFEKSITKALEMDFKGKTRYYMLYSYYLVKEKEEKEKALEVAEKGLKLDPNLDPESYKQMQSIALQLYLDLNKIDEALEGMQSSLAAASTDEDKSLISFNVGVLYEKKGDKEKALAAYTKSNELKPNFDALFNSGAMFFNEAVEIKKETDQMSLDEYNKKGKAVEEKAKVEFEKALPYFEKLYKMPEGKKIRVLGPLAQIYRIMGDTAKAEKLTDELETLED
jgi:tetratricopeptide (TPR) repeat protein